jgi:hypothetical protein
MSEINKISVKGKSFSPKKMIRKFDSINGSKHFLGIFRLGKKLGETEKKQNLFQPKNT